MQNLHNTENAAICIFFSGFEPGPYWFQRSSIQFILHSFLQNKFYIALIMAREITQNVSERRLCYNLRQNFSIVLEIQCRPWDSLRSECFGIDPAK